MRLPLLFFLVLVSSLSATAQLQQIITTSPGSTARQAYTISNQNDVYLDARIDTTQTRLDSLIDAGPSGGVTDGDKGDITVAGDSWSIDSRAVSFADMPAIPLSRLIGRASGFGFGDMAAITVRSGLSLGALGLGLGTSGTLDYSPFFRLQDPNTWNITHGTEFSTTYSRFIVGGEGDGVTLLNSTTDGHTRRFAVKETGIEITESEGKGMFYSGSFSPTAITDASIPPRSYNDLRYWRSSGNTNITAGATVTLPSNEFTSALDFTWNDATNGTTYFQRFTTFEEDFFSGGPSVTFGSNNDFGGPLLLKATHQPSFSSWFDDLTYVTKKYVDDNSISGSTLAGSGLQWDGISKLQLSSSSGIVTKSINFTPSTNGTLNFIAGSSTGNALNAVNMRTSNQTVFYIPSGFFRVAGATTSLALDIESGADYEITSDDTPTIGFSVARTGTNTKVLRFSDNGFSVSHGTTISDISNLHLDNDEFRVNVGGGLNQIQASSTGVTFNEDVFISATPTNNETATQILARNSTTGAVEYRTAASLGGGGGAATWGTITGTLSSQTDLQNALNAKAGIASANTFTARQDFTTTSTNASLRVGSFAGDPSSLSAGDMWYNSSVGRLRGYWGGPARGFSVAGFSILDTEPATNELVSHVGNAGLSGTDIFSRGSGVYEFGDPATSQSITFQNGTATSGDFKILHTTTGLGGMIIESVNNGLNIEAALGINITSNHTGGTTVYQETSGTNDVQNSLRIRRQSTGTPAIGIGARLAFDVEANAGASTEEAGAIDVVSTAVTAAAESFDMSFNLMNAGAVKSEKLLIKSTGAIKITTTPATDNTEDLVLVRDATTGIIEGRSAATIGGAGGASWGTITGTLSSQTDLQTALDAKADDSEITTINSTLAALPTFLSASAALDFASTGATAVSTLTISVPGAVVGNPCTVGAPAGSVTATASFWCWVSAADVVSVRLDTNATENPASGTFTVVVTQP